MKMVMAIILRGQCSTTTLFSFFEGYEGTLFFISDLWLKSFFLYGAPRLDIKIQSEKVDFPDPYCLQFHHPRRAELITSGTSILSLWIFNWLRQARAVRNWHMGHASDFSSPAFWLLHRSLRAEENSVPTQDVSDVPGCPESVPVCGQRMAMQV